MVHRRAGPHGAGRAGRAFHSLGLCVAPCQRPYLSVAPPAWQPRRAPSLLATSRLKNVGETGRPWPCRRRARTAPAPCTAPPTCQATRKEHKAGVPPAKYQRQTSKTRRDTTMSVVHRELLREAVRQQRTTRRSSESTVAGRKRKVAYRLAAEQELARVQARKETAKRVKAEAAQKAEAEARRAEAEAQMATAEAATAKLQQQVHRAAAVARRRQEAHEELVASLREGIEAHQLPVDVSECRGVWTATTPIHDGLLSPAWEVRVTVGGETSALFHGEKLAPDQAHKSAYNRAMA